jgi:uncharacterized protein HemX
LDDATGAAAKAEGEEAQKKAAERKSAAEAKLAAAESKAGEVREAKAAKDRELAAAQNAIRDADAATSQAAAEAKQATRRMDPVHFHQPQDWLLRQAGDQRLSNAGRHPRSRETAGHALIATRPGHGASLH